MNNFKSLLLGTSLSLIPNIIYAQCAVTDCQQLGYITLQKCDNGLKCPFGEYWACPKPQEEKAVLGQCTGYAKNCKIGQILNSDGTCTTDKENGKTPIGVVIYISSDRKCGQAMTANIIKTYVEWGGYGINIPMLHDCADAGGKEAKVDFKSCENTKIITEFGNRQIYEAAWAAVDYAPSAAPETKGKWCLPAAGALYSFYTNRNVIEPTILKLGGDILDNRSIWSSSELDRVNAWIVNDYGLGAPFKNRSYLDTTFRPVIEF